ncbi:MAG TPA: hypothetical protein VF585_03825 [Chthoniobacterales bacterium]
MSTATLEILEVCEALSPEKQAQVADFARFLLARSEDEKWERTLADPRPRPKLEEFLRRSMEEGSEPLDLDRL